MSVTYQPVPFSFSQSGFQTTKPTRRAVASPLGPAALPASADTLVHVVCNDAAQVNHLIDFFSSRAIRVNTFKTAAEYIANAAPDRAACVILDLILPDTSGLEVQSRLADRGGPPVVFLSAHGDLNSGVRAMKNGAIDFMIEPFDDNRLLAAVEVAFAQDRRNRHERVERASLLRRWNSLTPREQDVFEYTVAGFLNKQSAAELGIAENTIQVHRGRVMKKMKANSLADLVRMSTRLESLSRSQGTNEAPTQSTKDLPGGMAEERPTGASASLSMRHSYLNRVPTSASA